MKMQNKLVKAYNIANTYDVSTKINCAVVYSVSYMPNNKNKDDAKQYVTNPPNAMMLDDTPCGKALISLGLDGRVDEVKQEITQIWHIASSRYIKEAKGNITAFVTGADIRSTFCTTELHEILNNPQITHINNEDKYIFAQNFIPQKY